MQQNADVIHDDDHIEGTLAANSTTGTDINLIIASTSSPLPTSPVSPSSKLPPSQQPQPQQQPQQALGTLSLVFIAYFLTAGGPYGLENAVQAMPNMFLILIQFLLFPIIWSWPMSLICAELSSAMPDNGGMITWTRRAFGHFLSFQVGFNLTLSYILDNALYPLLFAEYLQEMVGSLAIVVFGSSGLTSDHMSVFFETTWTWWFVKYFTGVILTILLSIVNILGVQLVGILSLVFIIIVWLPMLFFPILGFRQLFTTFFGLLWQNFAELFTSAGIAKVSQFNWSFFITLLIWNNTGWMSVGYLAQETREPRKTFPRAMVITMILSIITYALPIVIGMSIIKVQPIQEEAAASISELYYENWKQWDVGQFSIIAEQLGGIYLITAVTIAAMICNAGLLNAALTTSSRSMANMAEIGMLPKVLAKTLGNSNTSKEETIIEQSSDTTSTAKEEQNVQNEQNEKQKTGMQKQKRFAMCGVLSKCALIADDTAPIVSICVNGLLVCVLIALPFTTLITAQVCIDSLATLILFITFIVLRWKQPNMDRPYSIPIRRLPLVLAMCILPIIICIYSIAIAGWDSQLMTVLFIIAGLVCYPLFCMKEFKLLVYKIKLFITKRTTVKREEEIQQQQQQQVDSTTTNNTEAQISIDASAAAASTSPVEDSSIVIADLSTSLSPPSAANEENSEQTSLATASTS